MDISKRKIFRDSLIYTILPKVSFAASLLILPLISPYLTLQDYGIYGLVMAYVSIFQIVIVLGQNILLQNSFFTHRENYKLVWKRSFGLMIMAGLVSSIILSLIIYLTFIDKLGNNWLAVLIMVSTYLILSPIDIIVVNYYVLKEKALPYAYGAALTGLITTGITFITIRYFKMGYLGWIISLPITVLLSYIYYARRIFVKEMLFPVFNLKLIFVKKALKIGLPLTPHQLSLYILGISDRLLLDYMKVPIRSIGLYSQGYNLGSQSNIIINGVFQALSKKLQDGFRNDTEQHKTFIKRSMIFIPLLISCILFSGGLWTKEIFFFLFRKPELREAYPIAIVVLCSYMFWSIYTFFTYPLSIKNKTFSVSVISLTAAGVNIAGNIILIPYYGIWAALGVTYFSYMIFGFAGLLNKENRLFLNKYINIIKLCVFHFGVNIALFLTAYLCKDAGVIFKIMITVFLLAAVGIFIKKIILKEVKYAISDI
ncbi:oligosaccharide flippase family protein [Mucilaginibacter sp. AW1-3]